MVGCNHLLMCLCFPHHFLVADYHQRCKAVHTEVISVRFDPRLLFVVLINTAQFEFLLKEVGLHECEGGTGREGEEGGREREREREREMVKQINVNFCAGNGIEFQISLDKYYFLI